MSKLYKIELEDHGWSQIVGFLKDYITRLQNDTEELQESKREEEWAIKGYDDLIKTYNDVINLILQHIRTIQGDLKEQGLELSEREHVR